MKKILLISGVLLALTATVASAAGINLYWNDCSVGGSTNKAFACASNAGTNSMVLSYRSARWPIAPGRYQRDPRPADRRRTRCRRGGTCFNAGTCRRRRAFAECGLPDRQLL